MNSPFVFAVDIYSSFSRNNVEIPRLPPYRSLELGTFSRDDSNDTGNQKASHSNSHLITGLLREKELSKHFTHNTAGSSSLASVAGSRSLLASVAGSRSKLVDAVTAHGIRVAPVRTSTGHNMSAQRMLCRRALFSATGVSLLSSSFGWCVTLPSSDRTLFSTRSSSDVDRVIAKVSTWASPMRTSRNLRNRFPCRGLVKNQPTSAKSGNVEW